MRQIAHAVINLVTEKEFLVRTAKRAALGRPSAVARIETPI
jgi:hypothetical protein